MIIAVTGANGHVGVNLCRKLIELGHEVRAFVHQKENGLQGIDVKVFRGNLLVKDDLKPFLKDTEIVFHLAARISISGDDSGGVAMLNVEGTRNMLEAAKEASVRRFIHFSSIHAFRQHPYHEPLDESRSLVKEDAFAYDRSKAEGENLVMQAAADGMDTLVLSPTAIVGPLDYEPGLMGQAFLQIYHQQIPALVPGGYDMVDVRDVVAAAVSAIENGKKGEKYLLSGKWHSIRECSVLIAKFTGKETVRMEMPFWVATAGLPFILLYSTIMRRVPLYTWESLTIIKNANKNISNQKARKELGFDPRSIEETIGDLFEWFKNNQFLKPAR